MSDEELDLRDPDRITLASVHSTASSASLGSQKFKRPKIIYARSLHNINSTAAQCDIWKPEEKTLLEKYTELREKSNRLGAKFNKVLEDYRKLQPQAKLAYNLQQEVTELKQEITELERKKKKRSQRNYFCYCSLAAFVVVAVFIAIIIFLAKTND